MTYDEWRESYHPSPLMNEAMARAAWDAATSAEREACIDIVANHGGSVEIEAAIRARGQA